MEYIPDSVKLGGALGLGALGTLAAVYPKKALKVADVVFNNRVFACAVVGLAGVVTWAALALHGSITPRSMGVGVVIALRVPKVSLAGFVGGAIVGACSYSLDHIRISWV